MNPLYLDPEFSQLLLLAASSLREVGSDEIADLFIAALYERQLVEQAIETLRLHVRERDAPTAESSARAQDYEHRMMQRLERCIRSSRVVL